MKKIFCAAVALATMSLPVFAADQLKVETSKSCSFVIQLRPDLAPKHVERMEKLAKEGFYNGIIFHRVIDGFMAQTGDPTGTGMGGSKEPDIMAEFSKEHFGRGIVGMARSSDPNSANSQFFIMFADNGSLDGQYTIVGQVDAKGMACVDQIQRGEPPTNPDKMLKVVVQ